MSMVPFITAMNTRFASLVTRMTGGGSYYFGIAPQEARSNYPYMVASVLDSGGAEYYGGTDDVTEETPVALMIVALSAAACYEALALVEKDLRDNALTLSTGTVCAAYSGPQAVEPDPELDEEGREVWLGRFIIEFRIQRSLT